MAFKFNQYIINSEIKVNLQHNNSDQEHAGLSYMIPAAQKHSQYIEASRQFEYGAAQVMPDSKVMFATSDA